MNYKKYKTYIILIISAALMCLTFNKSFAIDYTGTTVTVDFKVKKTGVSDRNEWAVAKFSGKYFLVKKSRSIPHLLKYDSSNNSVGLLNRSRPGAMEAFDIIGDQLKYGSSTIGTLKLASSTPSNNRPSSGSSADIQFEYHRLPRDRKVSFNTGNAEYILFMKSHGYKNHDIANAGWFRASGYNSVVGVKGSHDKAMLLVRVSNNRKIDVDVRGAIQYALISTNNNLSVVGSGHGGMQPNKWGHVKVQKLSSAKMTFYAEDEGGKGDRDQDFASISSRVFGTGDDKLYVVTGNGKSKNSANGAIMHINY